MHTINIKDKLAKGMLVFAVILVFLGLSIHYFSARYQEFVMVQTAQVNRVASVLQVHFNGRLIALNLLAGSSSIQSGNPALMREELRRAARTLGFYDAAVYDNDGHLVVDARNALPYEVYDRDSSYLNALSGCPSISGRIAPGGRLDEAYVSVRVPIYDKQHNVQGVLAGSTGLREVAALVQEEVLPDDQYIFVMDKNLQFVYHPRLSLIYPEENKFATHLRHFFQQKRGNIIAYSVLDEKNKVYVYSDVDNTDWRVVMAIPATAVVWSILRASAWEFFVFFLLLLCSWLSYRSIRQSRQFQTQLEMMNHERLLAVNQIAAGVAHEIRNPLTSIKGFIQFIYKKGGQAPADYLEIILAEIDRIEHLVNEFRNLARPMQQPSFKELNVNKTVADVVMLLRTQAITSNADIDFRPGSSEVVYGDAAQLKQVWMNLLRNALDAVGTGGKVVVTVSFDVSGVVVSVSDNGPGMPEELLKKVGTPFFTTKENGTGLGLSLCYSIVQNHGGTLQIQSTIGVGTTVSVTIPYNKRKGSP